MKKLIYTIFYLILYFNLQSQPFSLDTSFGQDGYYISPDFTDAGYNYFLLNDESLLIFGEVENYFNALKTLDPEGTRNYESEAVFLEVLDSTEWLTEYIYFNDAYMQNDGKIIVASEDLGLFRVNADWSLDTTFGDNGKTALPFIAHFVEKRWDNILLAGGYVNGETPLVALTPDGEIYEAYGDSGIVSFPDFSDIIYIQDINIDNNGRVHGIGKKYFDPSFVFTFQLDPFGQLDPDYGNGGILNYTLPNGYFMHLPIYQEDNKFLYTGISDNENPYVRRYLPNGAPDESFGTNGITLLEQRPGISRINSLIVLDNDQILLSGNWLNPNQSRTIFLVCLYPNGKINPNFGEDGYMYFDYGRFYPAKLVQRADGKVLLGCNDNYRSLVLQFLTEFNVGTLEPESDFSTLIYPNPISTNTTLEYTLNENSKINIALYNIEGKLIKTILENEFRSSGEQEESINLENIPSGNYILKISNHETTTAVKIYKK